MLLYGNRSALLRIAEEVELSGAALAIPYVCSSSETLHPRDEAYLRRVLGAAVFEVYGSSEGGNLAFRLDRGTRWTVLEPRAIVEVLDDQDRPVGPGGTGEIVMTTLTERISPLVRYRTGDLARVPAGTTGAGRSGMQLDALEGRTNDMVLDSAGRRVISSAVVSHAVWASDEAVRHVRRFQVHQHEDRRLAVTVELTPEGDPASAETLFRDHLAAVLGPLPVELHVVDGIDVAPGQKFRIVTSDAAGTAVAR
jgi:phenylacetate-CoA ligase